MRYNTKGVCSRFIDFTVDENNKIRNVFFSGGCNGNAQGLSALVEGMDVDELVQRVSGIRCGAKSTSCPDQLARAVKALKK